MAQNAPNNNAVVLIGGGFAGLTTALALSRYQPRPPILLIEQREKFIFSPLLYEVLSGEVQAWEISPSYDSFVSNHGIALLKEKAVNINTNEQRITTNSGLNIHYSQLIICTGAKPKDYKIPGLKEHAFMFQTIQDVELLREHINEINPNKNINQIMAIIGAGASGVELACKLGDLLNGLAKIHLIEVGESILPLAKSFNREQAIAALKKRKVQIHLSTKLAAISEDHIELKTQIKDRSILTKLHHQGLIWAGGTKPILPSLLPNLDLKNGKLVIDSSLRVIGLKNTLAIGDVAYNAEKLLPANAQVAMQQGEAAARITMAIRAGKAPETFEYEEFGEMLSLGIGEATFTGLGLTLSGPLAFQIRRMAYLTKLPNFSLSFRSAFAWLLNH